MWAPQRRCQPGLTGANGDPRTTRTLQVKALSYGPDIVGTTVRQTQVEAVTIDIDMQLRELVRWAEANDRPEAGCTLFAPGSSDRPQFAPGVPALGIYAVEERNSGLAVARIAPPTEPGPLDLVAVYLTAAELRGAQGARYPLADIEGLLEDLPVVPTLSVLASLTCHLEHRGPRDRTFQAELVDTFCPRPWRNEAVALLREDSRVFTSSQVTLALMRLAARHCRGTGTDVSSETIGALILALADQVTGALAGGHGTDELALARLRLLFTANPPNNLWGRAERIWSDTTWTGGIDPRQEFQDHFGMDLRTHQAAVMALRVLFERNVESSDKPLRKRLPITGSTLDPDTMQRSIDLISATPEELAASEDDPVAWDFTALRRRPLLRLDDSIIPVSLQFLIESATEGVFYLVEEAVRARAGTTGTGAWRTDFGRRWERYIRAVIEETLSDTGRIVPEDRIREAYPDSQVCDNALLYPDGWVLVEAVSRRMTLGTTALGGPEDLEQDLRKAVLQKAEQLAATVKRLSEEPHVAVPGAPEGARTFAPIIVLPGPFPVLTHVVASFRRLVTKDPACRRLLSEDVLGLVVMEATDFETLLATAVGTGETILDLLRAWQRSDLFDATFYNWRALNRLPAVRTPRWLREGAKEHLNRGQRVLFTTG